MTINGITRYDRTKYNPRLYPIRPTNKQLEEQLPEEVLMKGLSSEVLMELENEKGDVEKRG